MGCAKELQTVIVLDTCAVLWDTLQPAKLSATTHARIDQAQKERCLAIADITIWEIAMLQGKKRIELPTASCDFMDTYLRYRQVQVVPISPEIAEQSVHLISLVGGDPADRLIMATALRLGATLATGDARLVSCGLVPTIS